MLAHCASHKKATIIITALLCGIILLVTLLSKEIGLRNRLSWVAHGSLDTPAVRIPQSPESQSADDKIRWGTKPVPPTKIVAHAPGWTILDRMYVKEGIIYIVTDYPEMVPPHKEITSKGIDVGDGGNNMPEMEPTDSEIRTISTQEASELFGDHAIRMEDVTIIVGESAQYMTHYYHFAAELFFGIWRTYSSLDPAIQPNGHTILPAPRRMIFQHLAPHQWRDYAAMNQFILRAVFPSLVLEFNDVWRERAALRDQVFVYDRIVLSDRVASMHGDEYKSTKRIAAEATRLKASPNWWNTIRLAVAEFCKVRKTDVAGHGPPVITYVSRQKWGRRMLKEEDHIRLVAGLEALQDRRGVEVHIVELDRMSRSEQIRLAARTTIMMGVHGNGLTSLLWMKPTRRSAVIEFFYPRGFARDYQWTAQTLGIRHFGVWDNHVFTSPNLPKTAYPEGFQGNHIPLDAETVIDIIERQLDLKSPTIDA